MQAAALVTLTGQRRSSVLACGRETASVTNHRTKIRNVRGIVTLAAAAKKTQRDELLEYLTHHPLARSRDLRSLGLSGTVIARAVDDGDIVRLARGLYQLLDADIDLHSSLAEVTKLAPKAVICLVSALAFHGLTDQLPRKIWIAIGAKDWEPRISYPRIRVVRFREPYHSQGVETHKIAGATVKVYSVTKSIADAFRNPKLVDRAVAIESLKTALSERRASPGALASAARAFGAGNAIAPYLEALTANG